jgi:tRNA dimethylallyltransferase
MKNVIAIAGPTASGKSALAVEVAKKLNCEIISADSRQVYKFMPIATSVPSKEERQGIKHHFIEFLKPEEEFNAGDFGTEGRKVINEIFSRAKTPLIAGGSGLYIRSLIDGLFIYDSGNGKKEEISDIDKPDAKIIREELNTMLGEMGRDSLYEKLKKVDPEAASAMEPSKFRRVIRALEVYYSTGKKLSDLQRTNIKVDFETVQYGLNWDRKKLYERINLRVEEMIRKGLIQEVKELLEKGYHHITHNSLNTVGIKEVIRHLKNEISFDEMLSMIKQNTRRYAKRQLTWFRKDKRIKWMDIESENEIEEIAVNIEAEYKSLNPGTDSV